TMCLNLVQIKRTPAFHLRNRLSLFLSSLKAQQIHCRRSVSHRSMSLTTRTLGKRITASMPQTR
ncbi:hypothetical protein LTR40_014682, partial [Exophiala xenobiotica]